MKPNAEEGCSEKIGTHLEAVPMLPRHAVSATSTTASGIESVFPHECNGWHLTRQVEYDEGRYFLSGGKHTNS
jgi:hypothetical protein